MRANPPMNSQRPGRPRHGRGHIVFAIVAGIVVLLFGSATASAHTGFESSTPGDGTVVTGPVSEVTITFTGPAIPVGDKFTALDATGTIRTPANVTTDDGMAFVVTFEPPLAEGQVGVRWSVQAPDAHPIDGSFAFTVTAATSTATEPAATEPTTSEQAAADPAANPGTGAPPTAAVSAPSLEEFLATDTSRPGGRIGLVGRILGSLGVAFVVGGIAFLATTLRGSRSEIRAGLTALRVLGLAVAASALLEIVGLQRAGELTLGALAETPGLAMSLRLIGGLAVAGGLVAAVSFNRRDPAFSLSAAVLEEAPGTVRPARLTRWQPRASSIALFGVAAILMSFWFDGHTVSKGPRLVHSMLNAIHVASGSVWVGGVVSMAAVSWWRHRRGEPTRAAELIVRFSSIATIALVAVAGAGLLMAVFVLDSVGDLTGTEWGRILLLKTAFVAIAAAGGAYNHFRLMPALEASPDDEELAAELRSTLTAESIILAFVVVVTAWLTVAAS